jgi:secreted trypsin-like serine protease
MTVATARPPGVAVAFAVATAFAAAALAGPTPAGAIIAGTPEARSAYPAVVTLAQACTATLIAPDRLLTAGHCASHVVPGRTTVLLGSERLRVSRIARHPRFQYLTPEIPAEPYRDVALVELAAPASGVAPLRVSARGVRPGAAVTLVGFGTGDADRPGNFGVLRSARLVVLGDDACRTGLDRAAAGQGNQYRATVMLCTGDPDGMAPYASGCNGDSGAPLLRRSPSGRQVVVGVDSWGVACGVRGGDPEVFSRVAAELAFIRAQDPGWTDRWIPEPLEPGPPAG